jgi:hypothetical protein
MNVFVVSCSPVESAKLLPDKYSTKMPLECCQMTAVIYSDWYLNWGTIPKKDGSPYATRRGAFRNHPCTQWAAESQENLAWLLTHGLALCEEFEYRYSKIHACIKTLTHAKNIFENKTGKTLEIWRKVKNFVRAMPDELKYNNEIDTIEAYRKYVKSKGWTIDNYLRMPERKPEWMF